jgi:hypothetical protein
MAKRTPQQVLDAIDAWKGDEIDAEIDAQTDAELEAEMDRVLAMTPGQREAELRAGGVDVEAEKAKAREAYEKAQRAEEPAPPAHAKGTAEPVATNGNGKGAPAGVVVPISRARSRVVRWGAGFAIAAAIGGGYAATTVSGVMTSPTQYAEERRHDAEKACGRSDWAACLKALDDADRADPDGANDPHERELRRAAQAGLGLPAKPQ